MVYAIDLKSINLFMGVLRISKFFQFYQKMVKRILGRILTVKSRALTPETLGQHQPA